jgi:hypothetical protein
MNEGISNSDRQPDENERLVASNYDGSLTIERAGRSCKMSYERTIPEQTFHVTGEVGTVGKAMCDANGQK